MSLPAELTHITEPYFEPRTFQLIQGNDTAERFGELNKYIVKAGKRFWGLDIDYPDDPSQHLAILQMALGHIPELDKTQVNMTMFPAGDLSIFAHENVRQPVPNLDKRPSKKGRQHHLDITYEEAHDTPDIRQPAITAMKEQGDPVVEVITDVEEWRLEHEPVLDDLQLEVARLAYKDFLFSIGAMTFLRAIGDSATRFLHQS